MISLMTIEALEETAVNKEIIIVRNLLLMVKKVLGHKIT
jgi:hypothetical protein